MKNLRLVIVMLISVGLFTCKKEKPVDYGDQPLPTGGGSGSINGTTWVSAVPSFTTKVDAMVVMGSKLYLSYLYSSGGSFGWSGEYNGSTLAHHIQTLGSGTSFDRLRVFNNTLYGIGGPIGMYCVYDFTGSSPSWWSSYATNQMTGGSYTGINDMIEISGATFFGTGDTPYIKLMNGTPVGNGFDGSVMALAEFSGSLIAAGSFSNSGSTPVSNIAKWDGSSWTALGSGLDGTVYELAVYDNKLIAGGIFNNSGGTPCRYIAQWDGTSWTAVGAGMTGGFNGVRALHAYGTELFVGGDFTGSGTGVTCSNIMKWTGTAWVPMGGGAPDIVGSISVYQSKLYIANKFNSTGGNFFLRLD